MFVDALQYDEDDLAFIAKKKEEEKALKALKEKAKTGTIGLEQQLAPPQQQQLEQASSDCLGCRVTGLMLGLGGAGYVSSRLFEQPYPKGAHRVTLIGVSAALLALGLGRAVGF
eukprot:gene13374-13501_t